MHKTKRSIIYIVPFILPWDRPADYQRQTCFELAKRNQVVAYMQRDAVFILKVLFQNTTAYPSYNNIRFYRPLSLLPFRRFKIIQIWNHIIDFVLFGIFFLWGKKIILWIFDPCFYQLSGIAWWTSLYDCVDYHAGFHMGDTKKEVQKNEKKLIRGVDYFFVNSYILYDIHKKIRKSDSIVPQGFKLDGFNNTAPVIKISAKPIIGYVGALDYRLDYSLLEKLIRRNPQWQFVLWGPMQVFRTVSRLSHVITGESSDCRQVSSIIRQLSVAIIPFDTKLSGARYAFPMKLFEYFYMGKPVVSTSIEELKRFPKYVRIGSTVQEWEKHITLLLSKPWLDSYIKEQRRLASDNSWEKKIEAILSIIDTQN